jgi:uncharacterized protein YceH (UPF0502 family)
MSDTNKLPLALVRTVEDLTKCLNRLAKFSDVKDVDDIIATLSVAGYQLEDLTSKPMSYLGGN